MTKHPDIQVYTDLQAWDVIWKWTRFAGVPDADKQTVADLHAVLSELGVRSILDCACGLGVTTCALHKLGYEIEGADGSEEAVTGASSLATERGQCTRFFRSRWEELKETAGRQYDCVLMDSWDWCPTRRDLHVSAKGAHAVLRDGGSLLFRGTNNAFRDTDAEVEEEMKKEGRFQTFPVCRHDGITLTVLVTRERIPEGILGNRVHIIEEAGQVRFEVASLPDIRKWTWNDYKAELVDVGFQALRTLKNGGGDSLNVATK